MNYTLIFFLSHSLILSSTLQGFVYRGYDTSRGLVVAWESFVMLRKLSVTAITVASSDPYIQIFVALLLLIVSYGMQERVMPFETTNLNNIEGVGLFSLIFTQIVSILYLYIDSRAEVTGKKDKSLEYIVTGVLICANLAIVVAMLASFLIAWKNHNKVTNREFRTFVDERDEPLGPLSRHRNPRIQPAERLKIFNVKSDVHVHIRAQLSSEKTGETMERGKDVLISASSPEYVTPWCRRGRSVVWLELADGTGWIIHSNLKTRQANVELVGHREADGTVECTYLRFETRTTKPIPIRAGTSGFPFVWPTGEFVMPDESFLVDMRFVRRSRCCCSVRKVTYLHLADRRGWIVEPSFVPDVDWISEDGFVDESVLVRLMGTEQHPRGLSRIGVSEYDALEHEVPIYVKDTWPLTAKVGSISAGERFFVDDRSHVLTLLRFQYLELLPGYGQTFCCPRSTRICHRAGRFATFVRLSDGSGYVLTNRRSDDAPLVLFTSLRTDSVGLDSRSMLRWQYRTRGGATVHRSANAAVASMLSHSDEEPHALAIDEHYAPLAAGSEMSIITRRVVQPKEAVTFEITVGELERGVNGEKMGWIILCKVRSFRVNGSLVTRTIGDDIELLGVEIAEDHSRARAAARRACVRQSISGLGAWWRELGIARGDSVVHPTRGAGIVVAINPEDDTMVRDEMVHVEFALSFETQQYTEKTWRELAHTSNAWWTRRWNGGVVVGALVRHIKRGVGTIVAVSPEDDGRVHIEFETGETHRYAEQSWAKMSRTQSALAEAKKREQLRKLAPLQRHAERDAAKTINPMRQRAADLAKASEQADDTVGTLQSTTNPMQRARSTSSSSDATSSLQSTTNPMLADPSLPPNARDEETRAADDGGLYTQTQFIEHYGGTAEWDAAETREGEDGFQYKKADFIEHFSGTAEWDAATATPPPLREKIEMDESAPEATEKRESNWFYSDADDEVHGPFTLARLRRWYEKGHFQSDFMVRHGLHGVNEPLIENY